MRVYSLEDYLKIHGNSGKSNTVSTTKKTKKNYKTTSNTKSKSSSNSKYGFIKGLNGWTIKSNGNSYPITAI